jgi:hypothetical protein
MPPATIAMAASYHRPAAFAAAIDAITETLSPIGSAHDIGPMRRFCAAIQASMGGMRQIRAGLAQWRGMLPCKRFPPDWGCFP